MKYLEDYKLHNLLDNLIEKYNTILKDKEKNFFKNSIDPFAASIQMSVLNLSFEKWKKEETKRQTLKSLQNDLGFFHQKLLSSFNGWQELEKGNYGDIINYERKIIAEIKNKFNTVKGSDNKEIYDELNDAILKNNTFTAYYVTIISKNKSRFNKEFTPADNRNKGERRPINRSIRLIDGVSFYDIVSQESNTLNTIYNKIINYLQKKYFIEENLINSMFELYNKTF